jgi:hypothetical protein
MLSSDEEVLRDSHNESSLPLYLEITTDRLKPTI